jgi:peptide deformylase
MSGSAQTTPRPDQHSDQQPDRPGAVRTILTDENPLLREKSLPVERHDEELEADIADLAATLADFRARAGFGRAISAPQIGIMKRLIVMNLGEGPTALINPVITERSADLQLVWDDCLSVPGQLVQVERSITVSLTYTRRDGKPTTWSDLPPDLAELLQHECDHLDGILMTDRAVAPDAIRPREV